MNDRIASLLDFGADLQAQHDYPRTPTAFARAMRIRLIPGKEDSSNAGPPAIITYNARFGLNYRRFTLWHEIAHVVMGMHGIDRDFDDWIGESSGEVAREQTASLLAGQLMVPRRVVRDATLKYGPTPAAILEMQDRTGMSEAVCLRSFAFSDPHASRAAAVFIGNTVTDVTSNNYRIPFRRYDRVPEPAAIAEHARLQLVRKSRVIAVWEG